MYNIKYQYQEFHDKIKYILKVNIQISATSKGNAVATLELKNEEIHNGRFIILSYIIECLKMHISIWHCMI